MKYIETMSHVISLLDSCKALWIRGGSSDHFVPCCAVAAHAMILDVMQKKRDLSLGIDLPFEKRPDRILFILVTFSHISLMQINKGCSIAKSRMSCPAPFLL